MANTKSSGPRAKTLDAYMALIQRYPLRPIRNERGLDQAIAVINSLLDRDRLGAAEDDYLHVLGDLVRRYEEETFPFKPVSEAAMLEHLIEAKDVTQAEVARSTGMAESRISEVLSGKRRLTRKQLEKLADYFSVSPAVFLTKGGKTFAKVESSLG